MAHPIGRPLMPRPGEGEPGSSSPGEEPEGTRRSLKRCHLEGEGVEGESGANGSNGNGNGHGLDEHPHHEEKGQGLSEGSGNGDGNGGGKRARVDGGGGAPTEQQQQHQQQQQASGVPAISQSSSASSSSSFSAATGVLSGDQHQPLQPPQHQQPVPPPPAAAAMEEEGAVPGDDVLDVDALIAATMGDMEASAATAAAPQAAPQAAPPAAAAATGDHASGPQAGGHQPQLQPPPQPQPQPQALEGSGSGVEGGAAMPPPVGGLLLHRGNSLGASPLLSFGASPLYLPPHAHQPAHAASHESTPLHEPPPQEEGGEHPYSFPEDADTPLHAPVHHDDQHQHQHLPADGSSGASAGGVAAPGPWSGSASGSGSGLELGVGASPLVHLNSWGSNSGSGNAGGGDGAGEGGGAGAGGPGLVGRRSSSADDMAMAAAVVRRGSVSSSHVGAHGGHGGAGPGRSSKSIMQRVEKHKVLQGWEDDWLCWDDVFPPPATAAADQHLPADSASPQKGAGWGLGLGGGALGSIAEEQGPGHEPGHGLRSPDRGASVGDQWPAPPPPLPLPPQQPAATEPPASPDRVPRTASPTTVGIGPEYQAELPALRPPPAPPAPAAPAEPPAAGEGEGEDQGPTLTWSPAWADAGLAAVVAATGGGRAAVPEWSAEEVAGFERGLEAYRRNFGKVSRRCVPSRSVREVVARFYAEWKRQPGYRAWKTASLVGRRVLLERAKPPWKCLGGQDPIERVRGTVQASRRHGGEEGEDEEGRGEGGGGDEILDVRYDDGRVGQLYRYEAEAMLLAPDEEEEEEGKKEEGGGGEQAPTSAPAPAQTPAGATPQTTQEAGASAE